MNKNKPNNGGKEQVGRPDEDKSHKELVPLPYKLGQIIHPQKPMSERVEILERSVVKLWWHTQDAYQQVSEGITQGKKEGQLKNKHLSGTLDLERFRQTKKTTENELNKLTVEWGYAADEKLASLKSPLKNPAFSWKESFGDDIMSHGLMMIIVGSPSTGPAKDKPLDEGITVIVEKEIEKSERELIACGLILAKGNVMDKWKYWDESKRSNLPKALEQLNDGKPITLDEVRKLVKAKYPKQTPDMPNG